MSLAVFEDAARAHFSNSPATWRVVGGDAGWSVVDSHGAPIEYCSTKGQAEQRRQSGPAAARWHRRTDWYLGYELHGRALTRSERLIIADIAEQIVASHDAFRSASIIRQVRFIDQAVDDDRIWDAAELSNGRYQVCGDYLYTYDAGDLDFLDEHAVNATTDLTAFLRDLLAPADLRCTA